VRKRGATPSVTAHLTGYVRVVADSLDHAKSMLAGNPLYEAGGIVEIRELPRTDRPMPSGARLPSGSCPFLPVTGAAGQNKGRQRAGPCWFSRRVARR
jgi:hypothetical protein